MFLDVFVVVIVFIYDSDVLNGQNSTEATWFSEIVDQIYVQLYAMRRYRFQDGHPVAIFYAAALCVHYRNLFHI